MAGLPPENEFEERIRANYDVIFEGLLRNRQLKKPLIAAIEGYCVAGGTEILQGTRHSRCRRRRTLRHHRSEVESLIRRVAASSGCAARSPTPRRWRCCLRPTCTPPRKRSPSA